MAADSQAIGVGCAERFPDAPAAKILSCIQDGLKSAAPSTKKAQSPPNTTGIKLPGKHALTSSRVASSSPPVTEVDPTKGCAFLIETEFGRTHPDGTQLCVGKRSLKCDKSGKDNEGKWEYAWRTVSENDCISGYRNAKVVEGNATVNAKALKKMNESGE
jgi:hypothetical protein